MLRSRAIVSAIALLCATVAGCTAGQTANAVDPCNKVFDTGEAIRAETDATLRLGALSEHIIGNPECYSADAMAKARIALEQVRRRPAS